MGMFNFFGDNNENRVFNYRPTYYDPEKERSRVKGTEPGEYVPGSYIKGAFRDGHYKRSRSHLNKMQTIIGIVTLILIFVMLYFIAKYYSLLLG